MDKKLRGIYIILIIMVQCLVVIFWGNQKERFNVDEVFSYEGAKNSGYELQYWDKKIDNFYGNNYTKKDFEEHITIYSQELLITKPIELIKAFTERNVYYTILNLSATFTSGKLTKWTGIGLNIIFFILAEIVFYKLVLKICKSYRCAILAILLYGFSAGGISTVLYMRCYMMLTLLLLLACFCYVKCIESIYSKEKILYFIFALIIGLCCMKVHPFGLIFFAIITCGILLYMLLYRRNMYLIVGGGMLIVVGAVISIFYINSVPELIQLFMRDITGMTIKELFIRGRSVFIIISKHLWDRPIVFIILLMPLIFSAIRKEKLEKKIKGIGLILSLCICSYLMILMLGGAIAWKYISIVYPFIYFAWIMLADVQGFPKNKFVVVLGIALVITVTSYYDINISELFLGESKAESFFEENYSGINGVMVHADTAGENWLYDAAYLWPDDSKVNVQLLSTVQNSDRMLISQNEENEILLWLTIDYDNAEILELFMEKTPFRYWEKVYSTDSLNVYLCKK